MATTWIGAGKDFPAPEKRMAGVELRPNFDKTPIGPRFLSAEPGAMMRQLSVESQPFWQQSWWFSNDRAETRRIV
jgi:hypothetical protein